MIKSLEFLFAAAMLLAFTYDASKLAGIEKTDKAIKRSLIHEVAQCVIKKGTGK